MFTQFEEKGKIFTNLITKKPVAVHIQMVHNLIRGKVHVRPDERLKDELNQPEQFIAVTDARIFNHEGRLIQHSSFLAVNRQQILWLFQDDEAVNMEEEI